MGKEKEGGRWGKCASDVMNANRRPPKRKTDDSKGSLPWREERKKPSAMKGQRGRGRHPIRREGEVLHKRGRRRRKKGGQGTLLLGVIPSARVIVFKFSRFGAPSTQFPHSITTGCYAPPQGREPPVVWQGNTARDDHALSGQSGSPSFAITANPAPLARVNLPSLSPVPWEGCADRGARAVMRGGLGVGRADAIVLDGGVRACCHPSTPK